MKKATFDNDMKDLRRQVDFATTLAIDINIDRLKLEQRNNELLESMKFIKERLIAVNHVSFIDLIKLIDKRLKENNNS